MKHHTLDEFSPGQCVRYVPGHAEGDIQHPDCENGRVTSTNQRFVFVRFTGETSEACDPADLVIMEP